MIMTNQESVGHHHDTAPLGKGTLRHVRFVRDAEAGLEVLHTFPDPDRVKAVCVPATTPGDGIEVLTVAEQPREHFGGGNDLVQWVASAGPPGGAPPIAITVHGAQIIWSPNRAVVVAAPDRVASFLLALIDFRYYDNELLAVEREVGQCWAQLERDTPLAHEVTALDPERFEAVGRRMEEALKRRIRLARILPYLSRPRGHLPPLANQLMDRLREKTQTEERLETLQSQFDTIDRIYELTSQRISDFNNSRKERTLEWIIIVLLAAETILLLIDILWSLGV